jgi:glycosyltransferase involved in cell wall biosynthesis
VSIVTDLPDMERNSGFLRKLNNKLFKKTDGFIILTEQMNERVNPKGRPYIVLEGHVDSEAPVPQAQTTYEAETGKKVVMYAGSLKKIYGIGNLVEGFINADIPDSELRVYGDGDFREELEKLSSNHPNVRYMGIKSNQEIVAEEQKVSLLVNPRPIAPEYTKYSFPSKNMEYMVSGTPMLTTKLPGMPAEYYPYVYLIEDEFQVGIANNLNSIFAEPYEQRKAKAMKARKFVLEHKSNVFQAKKIINFLENEF